MYKNEKTDELSDKYKTIKQTAEMAFNQQKKVLQEIKDSKKISEELYEDNLDLKKIKLKNLEYKVYMIKSHTNEIEKNSEETRLKIFDFKKKIKEIKIKNLKLNQERNEIRRENFQKNIQLLKILRKFKVNSIEEIINNFLDESRCKQTNYSLFNTVNKQIAEMDATFSNLSSAFIIVKDQVACFKSVEKDKLFKENEFVDDSNNINIKSKTNDLIKISNYLSEKNIEKHNILKSFCRMLATYHLKLKKLILQLYFQNTGFSNKRKSFNSKFLEEAYIIKGIENINEWTIKYGISNIKFS